MKVRSKHLGRSPVEVMLSNWDSPWIYKCPTCEQSAVAIMNKSAFSLGSVRGFQCSRCGTEYHITEEVLDEGKMEEETK